MICRTCNNPHATRIKVIDGVDYCNNCTDMTETGGAKIDGSITRNSFRVREQQKQARADIQPPHVWDKASRKVVPNKTFIQNFPEQATRTFSDKEFKSVGITKLKGTK